MRARFTAVKALSLLSLAACSSQRDLPEQRTVQKVDLPRYMGRWFVIGSIPTMFETGATNATETYTWNEAEQRIDVDFRYFQDSPDGKEKKMPQKAYVENHDTNAEWKVKFLLFFSGTYLVLDLAPDYSWTLVGMPNRSHAWIMARRPTLDEAIYQKLSAKLQALGYDVQDLKKVPQVWR